MMTIWLLCCTFLALVGEVVAGDYGVVLPLFATAVFYFTVVLGWRRTSGWFLVFGSVLDLAFGRGVPVSLVALPGVQAFAMFWRRHGDCRRWGAQAVAGLAVGLISGGVALVLLVLPGARWSAGLAGEVLCILGEASLGGALLLPLLCIALDAAADHLVFDSYQQVRDGR